MSSLWKPLVGFVICGSLLFGPAVARSARTTSRGPTPEALLAYEPRVLVVHDESTLEIGGEFRNRVDAACWLTPKTGDDVLWQAEVPPNTLDFRGEIRLPKGEYVLYVPRDIAVFYARDDGDVSWVVEDPDEPVPAAGEHQQPEDYVRITLHRGEISGLLVRLDGVAPSRQDQVRQAIIAIMERYGADRLDASPSSGDGDRPRELFVGTGGIPEGQISAVKSQLEQLLEESTRRQDEHPP
jgi:hypothetical protein